MHLASFGARYRVVAVSTRQAGYDHLSELRPHLLVMETDLPDGEGIGLIRLPAARSRPLQRSSSAAIYGV